MVKKLIAAAAMGLAAALILNVAWYLLWPDVSRLAKERPAKSAFMEYRERQWQSEGLRKRVRQEWVPLARISPYLVKAVIIAEDDKFWSHEGFDFEAMQEALEKDLRKKRFRAGGSTISQQLAKNLYLSPSRNPIRKLKEAILTWRLERNLSKRRIIELYLNVAEWGDGIFGIEAASRHYFGKGAAALTPREAARLAVVLPSPLRYNPVGSGRYVEKRAETILRIMARREPIPDYDDLMNEGAAVVNGPPEGSQGPPAGEAGGPVVPESTPEPAAPVRGDLGGDAAAP